MAGIDGDNSLSCLLRECSCMLRDGLAILLESGYKRRYQRRYFSAKRRPFGLKKCGHKEWVSG